jgi:predicted Zn-dependent peptidase
MNHKINRAEAPGIQLESEINYLQPERYLTGNGIPVFIMRNTASEAVKIDLIFDAGSKYDEKPVAGLTTEMLLAGTTEKSMAEINDQIDDFGGYFNASVSADHAYLSIYGLNECMVPLVQLIEEAIFNAVFPEIELARMKKERKEKLKVSLEKVSTLAQRQFQATLFAGTPYGRLNQPEDFAEINREHLLHFFETQFKKGLRKINWVGNPSKEEIMRILHIFKRWTCEVPVQNRAVFQSSHDKITLEKKDAVQTGIRIGKLLFDRSHPDYHKMTVVNTILGEYFGSRLMSNIREDKGYTYGIGSYLGENQSSGYFVIATEVGKEFLEDTLIQINLELERMRNEPVPQEELDLVRNYLLGQFLRGADGPFAMMELFSVAETKGLDFSFYQEALKTLLEITPEVIQTTAHKHLNSKEMLVVTAG